MSDTAAMVAFLEAMLDDEEAAAQKLLRGAQDAQLQLEEPRLLGKHIPGWYRWPDVETMAARVLREIAAKRKILERYERAAVTPPSVAVFTWGHNDGYRQACLDAVRDLTAVYGGEPGYSPAWAPS